MKNTIQHRQIGERREQIGNITYIIRSFGNPVTTESPEQLILKLMESKIRNHKEVQIA